MWVKYCGVSQNAGKGDWKLNKTKMIFLKGRDEHFFCCLLITTLKELTNRVCLHFIHSRVLTYCVNEWMWFTVCYSHKTCIWLVSDALKVLPWSMARDPQVWNQVSIFLPSSVSSNLKSVTHQLSQQLHLSTWPQWIQFLCDFLNIFYWLIVKQVHIHAISRSSNS